LKGGRRKVLTNGGEADGEEQGTGVEGTGRGGDDQSGRLEKKTKEEEKSRGTGHLFSRVKSKVPTRSAFKKALPSGDPIVWYGKKNADGKTHA